jgi:hypothetical protein
LGIHTIEGRGAEFSHGGQIEIGFQVAVDEIFENLKIALCRHAKFFCQTDEEGYIRFFLNAYKDIFHDEIIYFQAY